MNNFIKVTSRVGILKSILNPVKNTFISNVAFQQKHMTRNVWYMCNRYENGNKMANSFLYNYNDIKEAHSKVAAERELVEFLTEEILVERKAQKSKTIATELDGFKAQLNGAEITLTKTTNNEKIIITFNVNNSVDTDSEPQVHPNSDKPNIGELKSKPSFKIDLVRNNSTLSLLCSFIGPESQTDDFNDVFGIDELSMYEGEWNENIYAVAGEVLDTYLYDLIMNYLEEKGISNEFVEKLSDYSTLYEHSAYIGLLEGLSKFASGK